MRDGKIPDERQSRGSRGFRGMIQCGMESTRAYQGADYCVLMKTALLHEALTRSVIGSSFEVHRTLGFGFLESHYGKALAWELIAKGHRVERVVTVPIYYKGEHLGQQRLDMVVDEKIVIEIKASENLPRDAQ